MTYGTECMNCGNYEWACICTPWCYSHDCERPCVECNLADKASFDIWIFVSYIFVMSLIVTIEYFLLITIIGYFK